MDLAAWNHNFAAILGALLENGAVLNDSACPPLHVAASLGYAEAVQILIEVRGAGRAGRVNEFERKRDRGLFQLAKSFFSLVLSRVSWLRYLRRFEKRNCLPSVLFFESTVCSRLLWGP